ncbi:MAG: ABC transporter permease [Candidatus Entotheonella gemina]|uniref:ABC transporter permease n=1 Tax=Candidatus Entotheonella gemina TaxID=1429439 RepID=W4LF13_9BACT|nr:MAG: ABC transporter permease [Candidatus Entotheonella gemina]
MMVEERAVLRESRPVLSGQASPNLDTAQVAVRSRGYWSTVTGRLKRDAITLGFGVILLAIILSACLAHVVSPMDPEAAKMTRRLKDIGYHHARTGITHWLGTDKLGRDMLSRLIYGSRMSLLMGVIPIVFAFVIGGTLGLIAGYTGGWANMLIMRTMDIFYAFPSVLLAIAISGALGVGIVNAIVALTLVFIPPITRVTESVTTQVRLLDYVDAARSSGAGSLTIIRVHIFSNIISPVFVYATGLISVCIILGAGLSFLGLGVEVGVAEWGRMLNELQDAIWKVPWVTALPGACIFVTSLSFNMVSDGLT